MEIGIARQKVKPPFYDIKSETTFSPKTAGTGKHLYPDAVTVVILNLW